MAASKTLQFGTGEVLGITICTGEVTPAWEFREVFRRDARGQRERQGIPVWTIRLISLVFGELTVTVPSVQKTALPVQSRVSFVHLVAGATLQSGFWFGPDAVAEVAQ